MTDKTQILKQAFDIYTTLSDLSVKDALARLQFAKFLKYWKRSDEAKQITQEVKTIIEQENYNNSTLNKWINDLEI